MPDLQRKRPYLVFSDSFLSKKRDNETPTVVLLLLNKMSKLFSNSLIHHFNLQSSKRGILKTTAASNIGFLQRSPIKTSSSIRFYSSTFSKYAPSNNDDDDDFILLYHRDSERNKLPQAAFAFSILNSTYWLWYTLDFIPAVNASPLGVQVSPMIGVGGVAFGFLINFVTGLYPSTLVSKLGYAPKDRQVHVWKHNLFPFITASKEAKVYPLGTLRLSTSSEDTQSLLQDSFNYSGHLGLQAKDERLPLLLEVRKRFELKDPELLLQVMLDPKAMDEMGRSRSDRKKKQPQQQSKKTASPEQATVSSVEPVNIKPRYAKKNKKR